MPPGDQRELGELEGAGLVAGRHCRHAGCNRVPVTLIRYPPTRNSPSRARFGVLKSCTDRRGISTTPALNGTSTSRQNGSRLLWPCPSKQSRMSMMKSLRTASETEDVYMLADITFRPPPITPIHSSNLPSTHRTISNSILHKHSNAHNACQILPYRLRRPLRLGFHHLGAAQPLQRQQGLEQASFRRGRSAIVLVGDPSS